jgi:hypothetical protein
MIGAEFLRPHRRLVERAARDADRGGPAGGVQRTESNRELIEIVAPTLCRHSHYGYATRTLQWDTLRKT